MITNPEEKSLIEKKIIYAGRKSVNFKDGTKVKFHFQTKLAGPEDKIIDDSRKMGDKKPLELVLGKKFKLEVWEVCIQKMALGEVASFTVDKSLVMEYPFVSKTLRELHLKHEERGHTCAMTIQSEGLGYEELNELMKNPTDLTFVIELLEVDQPEDYEKETWQMSEDEKFDKVPSLKSLGNEEFKKKNYKNAASHYATAIGILEQLMLKEKPHDVEWNELNQKKLPLLLNYSQCMLYEGDFYAAIEHCTEVLKTDSDNVKALYRRAKAHTSAWNPVEARKDFERAAELDATLTQAVRKELTLLENEIKLKDAQDKDKLKNLFN